MNDREKQNNYYISEAGICKCLTFLLEKWLKIFYYMFIIKIAGDSFFFDRLIG